MRAGLENLFSSGIRILTKHQYRREIKWHSSGSWSSSKIHGPKILSIHPKLALSTWSRCTTLWPNSFLLFDMKSPVRKDRYLWRNISVLDRQKRAKHWKGSLVEVSRSRNQSGEKSFGAKPGFCAIRARWLVHISPCMWDGASIEGPYCAGTILRHEWGGHIAVHKEANANNLLCGPRPFDSCTCKVHSSFAYHPTCTGTVLQAITKTFENLRGLVNHGQFTA